MSDWQKWALFIAIASLPEALAFDVLEALAAESEDED